MTTQPPVRFLAGQYLGLPGSLTRYFWVQAIYPSGRSVLSNLITISNAGSLTNQNQISLSWAEAPGAIGYDVIETATATIPVVNSTATIGIAFGVTTLSYLLSAEPVLNSWTYQVGSGSGGNISGSATLDFGSIGDGIVVDLTFTLSGAVVGNYIIPSWPVLDTGIAGMMFVSAANTVKVRLFNLSGAPVDPGSATYGATLLS